VSPLQLISVFAIFAHFPTIDHHAGPSEIHVYHIHCDHGDKHHIIAERGLPKDGVDISGHDTMTITSHEPIQWFKIDGKLKKMK